MDRLQRVEFDGALAVACLEMTFALVAVLDRDARQAVVPDLLGGQHQRVEPDIELFITVAAQDVLDLASDR